MLNRHRRIEHSVRTLTALMSVSLKEDNFGVVQLREPSLNDCVVSLLSALGALRQYIRLTVRANAPTLSTLSLNHQAAR
jgi:hypothetical protein